MRKLEAILNGCIFTDKLLSLREKEIKQALESANNDAEKQMIEAEIKYEELCKDLGKKEVDYAAIVNGMLGQKDIIRRAKETIEALKETKADLESEVEVEDEDKKKK